MSLVELEWVIERSRMLDHYDVKEIFDNLRNEYDTNLLSLYLLNNYDYDIEETKEEHEARRDYKFKKCVKERYDECCIITGNEIEMCDIAHIVPFSKGTEYEKYDVNNGIILSSELHKLFDKKILKINQETLMIEIAPEKLQNTKNSYNKFHNTKLRCDLNAQTKEYLRRFNNNLF